MLPLLGKVVSYLALWAGVTLGCGIWGMLIPVVMFYPETVRSSNPGLGLAMYLFGLIGLAVGAGVASLVAIIVHDTRRLRQPHPLTQ